MEFACLKEMGKEKGSHTSHTPVGSVEARITGFFTEEDTLYIFRFLIRTGGKKCSFCIKMTNFK